MKTFLVFLFILFSSISYVVSQTKLDVIYLVNGDIYKGRIIRDEPGDYMQIKIRDGSIKKFLYSEIANREVSDINQFNTPQPKIQKITFGIKSGLSYSDLVGDDIEGTEAKTGFIFGGFVNFPVNHHASFQVELMYVQHGAKHTDSLGEVSINAEIINIPVLVLIEFPLNDGSKLNLYPGVGIGKNISTIKTAKFFGQEQSVDYLKYMQSTVIYLTAGLSFETKISNDISLIFDLRGNTSITSPIKEFEDVKDISLHFMVGFKF